MNIENFLLTDETKEKISPQLRMMIENGVGYRYKRPDFVDFGQIFESLYTIKKKYEWFKIIGEINDLKVVEDYSFETKLDSTLVKEGSLTKEFINLFIAYKLGLLKEDKKINLYAIWLYTDAIDTYENMIQFEEDIFDNFEEIPYYKYTFKEDQKYFIASDLGTSGFFIVSNKPFELEDEEFPYFNHFDYLCKTT